MQLPAGLTARPLTTTDAEAVFQVMAAQEKHDIDAVEIELADIVGDWQRPSFHVEEQTVGVFDGDRLVAYGEVGGHGRADAAVDPAYRGRGIGTSIATWVRDTARSRGEREVGMPVPEGSAGDRLLGALGWRVRWTSWVLQLPPGAEIEPQPLPEGYTTRTAEDDADRRAAYEVIEDAFLEWSDRPRQTYEDFEATTVRRPGFQPWQLRLAVDPDGEVVGACFVVLASEAEPPTGFVERLAVRRDRRGLGLARALLVDAFARAREHGAVVSELSTDSRTGALGLYEKVGMVVTSTWLNRGTTV